MNRIVSLLVALFLPIMLPIHAIAANTVLSCDAFASHPTPIGRLVNNVWNQQAAGKARWEQCLLQRAGPNGPEYGWRWRWPATPSVVFAQPQITHGNTPWTSHPTPQSGFPIPLAGLDHLTISYAVTTTGDADFNLATTFWLTDLDQVPPQADINSIRAEFMVWSYASDNFFSTPAGRKRATVEINGIEWEVWVERRWHDTSGTNDNRWIYIAFRSTKNYLDITYNAAELVHYALQRGFLDSEWSIADIELGNEVMRGTGETWVHKFRVSTPALNTDNI
ncbi:GH12 family glycosyl hydrolase domain-containing protein [Teredinibacter turnerae]|uniref:GH12 family glycosyl hydrolase domain-containing protein n=1 Tax=Teredinibacter turnerae TaxID=2426 RepID=UPI003BAF0D1E